LGNEIGIEINETAFSHCLHWNPMGNEAGDIKEAENEEMKQAMKDLIYLLYLFLRVFRPVLHHIDSPHLLCILSIKLNHKTQKSIPRNIKRECYGPANVRVVVPLTYGGIRWGNRNDVHGEVEVQKLLVE
jgi:hypothetical protein